MSASLTAAVIFACAVVFISAARLRCAPCGSTGLSDRVRLVKNGSRGLLVCVWVVVLAQNDIMVRCLVHWCLAAAGTTEVDR